MSVYILVVVAKFYWISWIQICFEFTCPDNLVCVLVFM